MIKLIQKYLSGTSRHRIIYDREEREPYMERYYILFKDRPSWFPFNIFVHNLKRSDEDDLHDHPWPYFSLILKGGYWETTKQGKFWRAPGHFRFRKANSFHRLEIEPTVGEVWTLFCPGKRQKDWGFIKNGEWVQWRKYIDDKKRSRNDL